MPDLLAADLLPFRPTHLASNWDTPHACTCAHTLCRALGVLWNKASLEVSFGFLHYKLKMTWARTVAYILERFSLNRFFSFLGGLHSFRHLEQALMSGQEHSMKSLAHKQNHFDTMELMSSKLSKPIVLLPNGHYGTMATGDIRVIDLLVCDTSHTPRCL